MKGWGENERGVSFVFGTDVVKVFLRKNDIDLICRAHQVIFHWIKKKEYRLLKMVMSSFVRGSLLLYSQRRIIVGSLIIAVR